MAAMNKAQAQRYRQQQALKRTTSYGAEPYEVTRGLKPGDRYYDYETNTWQLKPGRGIPGAVGVDENELVTLDDLRGRTLPMPVAANAATAVTTRPPVVTKPAAETTVDDMLEEERTPSVQGTEDRSTGERGSEEASSGSGSESSSGSEETSGGTGEGGSGSVEGGDKQWSDTEPPGGSSEYVENEPDVQQARKEGWDWTPYLVGGLLTIAGLNAARSYLADRNRMKTSGSSKPATDTAGEADRGGTGSPDTDRLPSESDSGVAEPKIKPATDLPGDISANMAASGVMPPTAASMADNPSLVPDTRALAAATAGAATPRDIATRVAGTGNVPLRTAPERSGVGTVADNTRSVPDLIDPGGVARAGYYTGEVPPWDPSLGDFQDTRISEGPTVDAAAALEEPTGGEAPEPAATPRTAVDEMIDTTLGVPEDVKPDLGPVIGPAVTDATKPKGLTTYAPSAERQADDAAIDAARKKLVTNEPPPAKSIRQIIADIIMGTSQQPLRTENPNLPPEFREALRRRREQTALGVDADRGPGPLRGPSEIQDIAQRIFGGGETAIGPGAGPATGGVPLTPADIASQIQSGESVEMTTPPTDPLGTTQGQRVLVDAEQMVAAGLRNPNEINDPNTKWGKIFATALPDVKNLYLLALERALASATKTATKVGF